MAKRTENHTDLSVFGNRLINLMEEKGEAYNSGRKLAYALYDGEYFPDMDYHTAKGESDLRQKDIWKIEKQINKHMNSKDGSKINGKYLTIYSKFFNCSTDYLLGITDIKTVNLEIRQMCELTGLSEKAIGNFIAVSDVDFSDLSLEIVNEFWNFILESNLTEELRLDWICLMKQKLEYLDKRAEIEAWERIKEYVDSELGTIHNTKIESIRKSVSSYLDSFYGRLHKMTRDISVQIEKNTEERCKSEQYYQRKVDEKIESLKQVFNL